eukprot:scaffold101193_cov63-Phaeocystis_antarctica.AAC.2
MRSVSPSACACCRASSLVSGAGSAAALCAATCPSGDRATQNAASSAEAKPGFRCTPKKPASLSATSSVSPSACACCRASLLVSGAAAAALCAAACPSGDRATHSAASSAVVKLPRLTWLPPRLTYAL